MLENLTKNLSLSYNATGIAEFPLCQDDAEWIVEDWFYDGQVPLVDWGTLNFTAVSATVEGGSTFGPDNAIVLDMEPFGQSSPETKTTVKHDVVSVQYIGPH